MVISAGRRRGIGKLAVRRPIAGVEEVIGKENDGLISPKYPDSSLRSEKGRTFAIVFFSEWNFQRI